LKFPKPDFRGIAPKAVDGFQRYVHTCSMRRLLIAVVLLLKTGNGQTVSGISPITTVPLNPEQISIYRAALSGLPADVPYELVDLTGVLHPDEGDFATCMKDFPGPAQHQALHHLSSDFTDSLHIHLLHLISPQAAAEHPIPFAGSTGGHSVGTPDPLPIPEMCRITLSEIVYDTHHQRAALNVTIRCTSGDHSETHVYKNQRSKWVHLADFGSGIS
jgi:hypothetical protein